MEFMVNGNIWRVQLVNPTNKNLYRSDGSLTLGTTDRNKKTVFLSDMLNDYMTDKVLVHELAHVHAMEYNYYMPIEVEEIVCDFMSLYGREIIYIADELIPSLIMAVA